MLILPEVYRDAKDYDEVAVTELDLTMNNEGELYPQKSIIRQNLAKKLKKGVYDPILAHKAWSYWVTAGAKDYAKRFGTGEDKLIFSKADKHEVARRIELRERETLHEMLKPICPNCEQWQEPHNSGHLDCFHECALRGFAPKINL